MDTQQRVRSITKLPGAPKNLCYNHGMKVDDIDVNKTIEKARAILAEEKNVSSAFKAMMEVLFLVITLLMNRLGLNSKNSSKSPATDPNRTKKPKDKNNNNSGGQKGHAGTNLQPVDNPDEIVMIPVNEKSLPKGEYHPVGYDRRQVINMKISRHVIEYRAEILENNKGKQFIAAFPDFVTRPVQYGQTFKAHSVYLSQFQLLPYNRIEDYFREEMNIPISQGSIFNFNKEAYELLKKFDTFVKQKLVESTLLHVDETGINILAKNAWLHVTANAQWTYFYPHIKRGSEAMNDIGILPNFKGTLCHDHWKPYFIYLCDHSLCNAHHLRELERAFEQDKQAWAFAMKKLLLNIHKATQKAGGELPAKKAKKYYKIYRAILEKGSLECPLAEAILVNGKKKKGRVKQSKARNLLDRLVTFENDVLRFMENVDVPFTNNLAENNIRMTKVQRKISGCFRSMEGAYIFCRIRSYISTCRKQGMSVTLALKMLFEGNEPDFMQNAA